MITPVMFYSKKPPTRPGNPPLSPKGRIPYDPAKSSMAYNQILRLPAASERRKALIEFIEKEKKQAPDSMLLTRAEIALRKIICPVAQRPTFRVITPENVIPPSPEVDEESSEYESSNQPR